MRLQEDFGLIVVNLCGILKVTILRFKMCQASLRAFDTQEEIPCCLSKKMSHTYLAILGLQYDCVYDCLRSVRVFNMSSPEKYALW